MFLADRMSPDLCRYLNSQGFLTEREGNVWKVVLETDQVRVSETDRHRLDRRAQASGLAGLMVLGSPVAPSEARQTNR